MEEAFNKLKKDTSPGSSGNITLFLNHWAVRGTLLQSILNNWATFK